MVNKKRRGGNGRCKIWHSFFLYVFFSFFINYITTAFYPIYQLGALIPCFPLNKMHTRIKGSCKGIKEDHVTPVFRWSERWGERVLTLRASFQNLNYNLKTLTIDMGEKKTLPSFCYTFGSL